MHLERYNTAKHKRPNINSMYEIMPWIAKDVDTVETGLWKSVTRSAFPAHHYASLRVTGFGVEYLREKNNPSIEEREDIVGFPW